MPLNRLHPPRIDYPKNWGSDALPLLDHIKYDKSIDAQLPLAFQQVLPLLSSHQAPPTPPNTHH